MDMLDATLAFALTLAALATIVTIIIEAIHRLLRMRKWNLILIMKKLSGEIANDKLLSGRGCWDFVASVVNNGTRTEQQQLQTSAKLLAGNENRRMFIIRFFHFLWDKVITFSYGNMHKLDTEAKKNKDDEGWLKAIDSIKRNNATRGVFDKVSIEHVLRRYSELDEVKAKLNQSRDLVEAQLDKIARKYEEFASSVTADFKRRAQMWSIIIGVLIALVANVNAARIFESYLNDKNLSSRVIGQFEEFEKQANVAQKRLEETLAKSDKKADLPFKDRKSPAEAKYDVQIINLQTKIEGLVQERGKLTEAKLADKNKEINKEQLALKKLIEQAYAESEAGKAQQVMDTVSKKLRSLSELGVPIGIKYYPHCEFFNSLNNITSSNQETNAGVITGQAGMIKKPDNLCLPDQQKASRYFSLIGWFLTTIITGILIGMGAPFWFDVARRIAEVRSMFGGKQDNEKRMSGKDIDGSHTQRRKLVKNIVNDAIADQKFM
ncbi:hypothetical protein MNBD_GAMMA21-985 [hydrothermal vent metagenome]|uniref:Uncharacterized protein n=1 Tax=hydrothermal vent metagenome TaxID=652676 RepID=A0A3B1B521_9ZZZZ